MTTKTTKLIGLGRSTAVQPSFSFKQPLALAFTLVLAFLVLSTASASAETTGPVWKILSVSNPTNLKPGDKTGDDILLLTATNVGGGSTDGSTVTVSDALPSGLKAVGVLGVNTYKNPVWGPSAVEEAGEQPGSPLGLSCSVIPVPHCTTSERIDPGDSLIITVKVDVESDTEGSSEVNGASVSGGGAVSASVQNPVTISSALPAYGVAKGGLLVAASTSQAGGHPNVTSTYVLNTINKEGNYYLSEPVGPAKDISFDLPPGLVGTTVGVQRCTMAGVADEAECPRDTMVGTATLIFRSLGQRFTVTVPVFNIAPEPGEPVAFAFNALLFAVRLDTSVLSGGDYGVRVTAPDITTGADDYMTSVTIWGDPAEHYGPGPDAAARTLEGDAFLTRPEVHPQYSFGGRGIEEKETSATERTTEYSTRVPLLTNPSQCATPLEGIFESDSWEASGPGVFATEGTSTGTETGCDLLSFKPSVSMLPDTLEAGAPAGYSFDLNLPQNTEAEGLATPDVKRTSVTLPLGTVISPSAADGLGDCTHEQFYGSGPPEPKPATPGSCPRNSQVGEIRVKTPALEERLHGDVYLGSPECTGPNGVCTPEDAANGHMVHLYAQFVSEGEDGIVIKLEGKGMVNQQTGQITTVFENTPQLPFSQLELTLQGGERATLANPRTCGEVHTTADLTPWSTPFTPDASPESNFNIDENCFGAQFNPTFTAGTTSNQAGGFSPFTVSFGRSDADQFLNGVQIQMPPGLLGLISKVSLCEEPQAAQGTCGPASQIGETSVETGPGADPFLVTGGKIYITGPYKGAPYGLSIVVPAKAGPYTLSGTTGNGTVVVRAAISANPETAALTVTVDPLPTELDGIPLQLRLVNATVGTNDDFTFNPTDCNELGVGGTLTSTEAAKVGKSSSFQVTNCAALKFKPSFTATSNAHTSKKDGASLLFKISYPKGSQGSESWLKEMKFDIPKQLPARLTTLQKSCLVATFEANPAACPAASVIGKAIVHTPVLPAPLEGPVYFVSHGGAKFPEVVVVLQADNVSLELHGETFISRAGVTSATFRTVPDAPFESAEVYVPTGPNSEFAAIGNICTQTLTMPNEFTPQSGAEIKQDTKIGVTGCPKAKKATKKKKKAKKASRARKSSTNRGAQS